MKRASRNRHDAVMLGAALVLFGSLGGIWKVLNQRNTEERERVLAHTPDFPEAIPHSQRPPRPHREAPRQARPAPVAPAASAKPKSDPVANFAAHAVKSPFFGLINAHALMNSPLIRKLDKCFGQSDRDRSLQRTGGRFDPTRDVDQIAVMEGGEVRTGVFGRDPESIGDPCPDQQPSIEYRGFTIYQCTGILYAMQDSMVVTAFDGHINSLVDSALDAPPEGTPPPDLSGDLVIHTDFDLSGPPKAPHDTIDAMLDGLSTQASNATFRANVWDSLAVSIDAQPRAGGSAEDISNAVRALVSAVREEIDPDDVQLSALSDLAEVGVVNGAVRANVAVPADQIVDRLNALCEKARHQADTWDGGPPGSTATDDRQDTEEEAEDPSDGG